MYELILLSNKCCEGRVGREIEPSYPMTVEESVSNSGLSVT